MDHEQRVKRFLGDRGRSTQEPMTFADYLALHQANVPPAGHAVNPETRPGGRTGPAIGRAGDSPELNIGAAPAPAPAELAGDVAERVGSESENARKSAETADRERGEAGAGAGGDRGTGETSGTAGGVS